MKARVVVAILLVLFAASFPNAVTAQEPGPKEPGFGASLFPPDLVMQNQRRLGLTAEQRTAITNAIKELQGEVLDLQWRAQEEEQRLADLLKAPSVDAAAALAQIDRLLEIERRIKKAHLALLIKIKNTLTPEQQAILDQVRRRE